MLPHKERVFAHVIKDLDLGRLSWISWVALNPITRLLEEKEEDLTCRREEGNVTTKTNWHDVTPQGSWRGQSLFPARASTGSVALP